VAFFWYQEGQPRPWSRERLLPTGTVELVFAIDGPRRRGVLCGPHNQPFFLENPGSCSVVAAHFRPGGAFPFFRVPPDELRNQVITLDDVWGWDAAEIEERLLEAGTLAERFAILEAVLTVRATGPLERRPEVRFALRELRQPRTSIAHVANQVGYCRRHFIETFKGEVGLTPKAYARVKRFQHALSGVGMSHEVDWAGLAYSCGYYDQSHLANDFRAIAGLTPSDYLALRTPHLNHVPVQD
jgi:AraC-like DNA-binding protein